MNRLQEQELIDAMADIHRLRAELVGVAAERDALKERAESAETQADAWQRDYEASERREREALAKLAEMTASYKWAQDEADALKEQVEAAREAIAEALASLATKPVGDAYSLLSAALARLGQQETE